MRTSPKLQTVVSSQQKRYLFLFILLAVLVTAIVSGFGGYYLAMVKNTPVSTQISVSDVSTSNWEVYSGSEYSFKYPAGLTSDTSAAGEGADSIRFQFMGSKQVASGRTQTSLFDGYAFVVTKIGSVSQKTPEQIAEERRINSVDNCGPDAVLSGIKKVSLGKGTGVQYSVKNCMGDYTSSYISNGSNVYEITQLYVGEMVDQQKYQEITNQMLSTLEFQ